MYHVVKHYQNIGHALQLTATRLVAGVQNVSYTIIISKTPQVSAK